MSVSFLIKLQAEAETCNFIKKETLAQIFSCEFWEISKNTFFAEHLWATAFVNCHLSNCSTSSSNFNIATSSLLQVGIKLRSFGKKEISFSVRFHLDKLITFLLTNLPFNRPLHISALLLYIFDDGVVSQLSESLIL